MQREIQYSSITGKSRHIFVHTTWNGSNLKRLSFFNTLLLTYSINMISCLRQWYHLSYSFHFPVSYPLQRRPFLDSMKTVRKNVRKYRHPFMITKKHSISAMGPDVYRCSVADPGCLSRIPDPTFFHPGSRIRTVSIPDPGSSSKNLSILTPKKQKMVFKL